MSYFRLPPLASNKSTKGNHVYKSQFIWVNEDALPENIDGKVYDFLWPMSELMDGCRMFPWPVRKCNELLYQPDERYNPPQPKG